MNKSIPSVFGKLTSSIFDEYPIYKCQISSELVNSYFPDKLVAFDPISSTNFAKRKFFYSKPIIFASRSQISDQFEELSNTITLEDLLEKLLLESNDINRYNFIITGNCLIFVKIAHVYHVTYHILCKHITLSNRSDDVRFAGELWCDQNKVYRLNNNSGTYRPENILIEKSVQLFNQLTPRLQFEGISYQMDSQPTIKYRFIYKIKNRNNQMKFSS